MAADAQYLKLCHNIMLFRPRPLRARAGTNFGVTRRVWLADAQKMHSCAAILILNFKLEFWSRRASRTGGNHNREEEDCNQPLDAYPFSRRPYPAKSRLPFVRFQRMPSKFLPGNLMFISIAARNHDYEADDSVAALHPCHGSR